MRLMQPVNPGQPQAMEIVANGTGDISAQIQFNSWPDDVAIFNVSDASSGDPITEVTLRIPSLQVFNFHFNLGDCSYNLNECIGLTNIDVGNNAQLSYEFSNFPALTTFASVACNSLQEIVLQSNPLLSSVDLTDCAALITVHLDSNPSLSDLSFSALPVCALFDASACALPQSIVDTILTTLAANSVSNGFCNLSSGTNAAPSATGDTAKATLEVRGWQVFVNT